MGIGFLVRKWVVPALFSVSVELLVLGLVFLWFTRRQRTGRWLVTIGVFALLAFSYGASARLLIGPIERQYAPVSIGSPETAAEDDAPRWVVVLGSGDMASRWLRATAQLWPASLAHREAPQHSVLRRADPAGAGSRHFGPLARLMEGGAA